ncbi:hypothetical protein DUNSADRAFT_7661 [Dunaliella salina]|uniref:Uncharacterized protein n=1 Tax=Dunaliella salina TaxID=3046 RepID=A0ABQ7H673_DUNSA|nr:hypothetical protein DUNSADRAFT_7661 [Dunaliella salina]|eukprot:KAF5842347.1 hypothetical protein DUNSADRAFT_7661 [Dunaliella salina]
MAPLVDTTSYLEAKTWLITSVSNLPDVPASVRLQALAPYLKFAAAQHTSASQQGGQGSRRSSSRKGADRKMKRSSSRSRSRSRSKSRGRKSGGRKREGGRSGRARSRSRSKDRSRSRSRGCDSGSRKQEGGRSGRARSRSRSRDRSRSRSRSTESANDDHRFSASPSPPSSPRPPSDEAPPPNLIVHQLLLLLLEQRRVEVARLLARQPLLFRDFFVGSDLRIMMWFSHFSMSGMTGFKYGAFALAHYALAHRDEAWQYIVWEGKHAQAPVSVATKTHYFCEINVLATVRNFAEHCPSFWSSEQLLKTFTKGGEIIQLDPPYFAKVLYGILCRDPHSSGGLSSRAQDLLEDFVCQESWQLLSHRLLSLMGDDELLELVSNVSMAATLKLVPGVGAPTYAGYKDGPAFIAELEQLAGPHGWQDLRDLTLSGGPHWVSLPHLVLTHALANHRGKLQGMLQAEEDLHAKLEEVESIALHLHGFSSRHGRPFCGYQAPVQEHHHLLASLRPPALSASSRQLLALEAWTLRLALVHASRVPVTALLPVSTTLASDASRSDQGSLLASDASRSDQGSLLASDASRSDRGSLLEATLHSLGGTCKPCRASAGVSMPAAAGASHRPASSQRVAALSGQGGVGVYDLLPSSSSSSSEENEDSDRASRHRKRRHKEKASYELLSSSDGGGSSDEGEQERRRSKRKASKEKRKKHKQGKKSKKRKKAEKKRRRSPSSSRSSRSEESERGAVRDAHAVGSSRPSHRMGSRENISDEDMHEAASIGNGRSQGLGQLAASLFEVHLPTFSVASGSRHGWQQGRSIHATGTAQDIADLLACAAAKHWLQASLMIR